MGHIARGICLWLSLVTGTSAQAPAVTTIRAVTSDAQQKPVFPAQLLRRFRVADRSGIAGVAFVPHSSNILVLQHNNVLLLLQGTTGQILADWKGTDRSTQGGLALSSDGRTVAVGEQGRIVGLSLPELKPRWTFTATERPQTGVFQVLAFSPDGKKLVAGGFDWPLQLIDAATGKLVKEQTISIDGLRMLQFSRDSQAVFFAGSMGRDGTPPPIPHAGRWNLGNDALDLLEKWPQRTVAYALWEQPDGTLALHGSWNSGIRHLDAKTLAVTSTTPFLSGWAATVSGDGRRYAFATMDGQIWPYDAEFPRGRLGAFSAETRPQRIALNHAGTELLIGTDGGDLQWWRLRYPRTDDDPASAVDPDNLFAATDLSVPQVSAPDDESIVRFDGHRSNILTVTPYPDSVHVLTTSADQRVLLWDLAARKLARRFDGKPNKAFDMYFGAAISPNGKHLLLAGGQYKGTHHLDLWEPMTLEKRLGLGGVTDTTWAVAISADGKLCAAGGHRHDLVVWETQTGNEKVRIALPQPNQVNVGIRSVAFSGDGQSVISCFGGMVTTWSVETGKETASKEVGQSQVIIPRPETNEILVDTGHGGELWGLPTLVTRRNVPYPQHFRHAAFSADGKRVALGGNDRLEVWDIAAHERLFLRTGKIDQVSLTPDGKTVLFTEVNTLATLPIP